MKLPNELVGEILSKLRHPRHLAKAMRVSKSWNQMATRLVYRDIVFKSVKQRERFFSSLTEHTPLSPTKSPKSPSKLRELQSPVPPPVRLTRKSMRKMPLRVQCVRSLHFGLGPRMVSPVQPQLPSVKSVLSGSPLVGSPEQLSTMSSPSREPTAVSPMGYTRHRPGSLQTPQSAPGRLTVYIPKEEEPYGAWEDRFINPLLPFVGYYFPHLKSLSISGCHVNDFDFIAMLEQMQQLEFLDMSYSTVKNAGLEGVSRYLRHSLVTLNVSGIFKFGRNRTKTLLVIAQQCQKLKDLYCLNCPEVDAEDVEAIREMSENKVQVYISAESQ
ncbi:hypothetical protein EDD86DRAFT_212057 [Gorgonomyces haynaldii]|nr:hypothetical protein EDD86DRAFT_212057 [Gorgonomyces haynaldii]